MTNIQITQEERDIDVSGDFSVYRLPIASSTTLGGIKVGDNLTIEEDGTLNAESTEYNLPVATASTLGGIKVGSNLTISDGVLTATVDNALSNTSNNPVRNSVVTSNINSLSSDISGLDTRLDNDEDNITTNADNITTLSGDLDDLSATVTTLSGTVDSQGDSITNLSSTVGGHTSDISDLDSRLDTAEDNIVTIQGQLTTAQITSIVDDSVSYTSLLPVATWTSGDLTLHKRSLLGFLFINLEGNFLLGANSSTTIYTLQTASNIPLYTTSATVFTDAGNIVLSATDQGEIQLTNPTSSALTITKVYGNVPLVY